MSAILGQPREFVSYSANLEDVLLRRLFPGSGPGFYVDVGAGHPEFESDTKALRDRGWRGVNVEPNPEFLTELKAQRPDDVNLGVVPSEIPGELVFHLVPGTGLSTLDAANAKRAAIKGRDVVRRCVKVTTLAQVLEDARAPSEFNLLKVDLEGAERAVLAGNDWARFRPRIVIAEATVPESPVRRDDGVRERMQSLGWRQVWFDGLNDWYLAPGFEPPARTFDSPPNVFDRYVTRRTAVAEAEAIWLRDTVADRDEAVRQLEAETARLRAITETRAAGLYTVAEALAQVLVMGADHLPVADLAAQLWKVAQGMENGLIADKACVSAAQRLLEADNPRLRATLADVESELARHCHAVAELQAALANSRKEVAAANATIGTIRHEMTAQQSLLENIRHERVSQQARLESLQQERAALLDSTSWRMSKPIRVLGRLLGRGRPIERTSPIWDSSA